MQSGGRVVEWSNGVGWMSSEAESQPGLGLWLYSPAGQHCRDLLPPVSRHSCCRGSVSALALLCFPWRQLGQPASPDRAAEGTKVRVCERAEEGMWAAGWSYPRSLHCTLVSCAAAERYVRLRARYPMALFYSATLLPLEPSLLLLDRPARATSAATSADGSHSMKG